MDPVSALLAIAFVFGIIRGMPAVIEELREAGMADADARRIRRLTDAGITPATRGGALGRYLGNLWREHVTGRGQRADKPTRDGSLRQRLGDAARRWSDRWRGDGTSSPGGASGDGTVVPTTIVDPAGSNGGGSGGGGSAPRQRDPIRAEATVDKPTTSGGQPTSPQVPNVALPGTNPPAIGAGGGAAVQVDNVPVVVPPPIVIGALPAGDPTPATGSDVEPARGPIQTVATVGAPARGGDGANAPLPISTTAAPQQITGGTTMSGAVEVTGVSSGLAAAQAIQAQVQAAVEQFAAAMAAVDRNLAVVEAGAAGLIQFDGRGEVMQALAQAREAASGARRAAHQVAEVMVGLLGRVANAFRRRL